ncbi:hypothetical protein H5410_017509 [Solanum commersonii]|uniref:Uncharacterized protein n=1 Tax=Solanum commersonii TaxID=4109 RepID=A0A9J5ZZC6_SOLCO|nr:hypothetical protein H5410_017509 [Solanum commersonii]
MGVLKTSQSIVLKCWWIMLNTNPKLTHLTIKQVDQKAAKVACESIIHQETEVEIFQFLYEKKMKPKYNIRCHAKGQSSVFICHLAFGGKTYIGEEVGNKKWLNI